ncbi:MAG: hypothetical protein WCT14_19295 [Treponemataceae bacterium]
MKAASSEHNAYFRGRTATLASPLEVTRDSRERKRCLDLRGRIVLSPIGTQFFIPRVANLHRFDGGDGEARYGFRLKSIDVPWLRRLLLSNFIDKAEFPVRSVAGVKNEITDLSRLVVFSLLYGRFNSSVLARVIDTDVIRRWNRQHPHRALDVRNAVSPPELRAAMEMRKEAVEHVKREIIDPLRQNLTNDMRRNPEDRKRLSHFIVDLVKSMDPLVFFVLLAETSEKRRRLIHEIGMEIEACLDKTDLADYLVLMVLELMSAAERVTLIDLIGPGHTSGEIRSILENTQTREEMLAKLPHGLSASMAWSLSRRWSLDRWRYRLRLGLHDGTSSFEDGKRLFEERANLVVRDRSLKEFYEQGTGPYGDDGLGWYYLSFLADACSNMGIQFEASVREKANKGTAAVNLSFVF